MSGIYEADERPHYPTCAIRLLLHSCSDSFTAFFNPPLPSTSFSQFQFEDFIVMGRLVKGVGALVGLATEAAAHNKKTTTGESERQYSQDRSAPSSSQDGLPTYDQVEQQDEESWILDETATELSAVAEEKEPTSQTCEPSMKPKFAASTVMKPLPFPVIIPQRRPQKKSRGFVQAYAPLLGECKGLDEATFHKFLHDFHQATQASPYLRAINIAAMIGGAAPSAIAMAVSASVSVAARGAIEVQNRVKSNNYLDKANAELFHPLNLHCMIMSFKPEQSNQTVVDVDMDSSNLSLIKSFVPKPSTGGKYQVSSGTTTGEFSFPETAPLVFPTIDRTVFDVSESGKPLPKDQQNAMKRGKTFISSYLDRRAQAAYAGQHGESSKLAIPGAARSENFASRWSDPNHPANSGSLVALLTGGVIDPDGIKRSTSGRFDDARSGFTGDQRSAGPGRGYLSGQKQESAKGGVIGGVKKVMTQDVLYLMIAEMPSPQEMERLLRSGRQ